MRSDLLRRTLAVNAATSIVLGLVAVAGAGPLGRLMGAEPILLAVLGAGVLLFGLLVGRNARRPITDRREAVATIVLDTGWVAGSVAVLAAGVLTTAGAWIVAIIALDTMLFAVLQAAGLGAPSLVAGRA